MSGRRDKKQPGLKVKDSSLHYAPVKRGNLCCFKLPASVFHGENFLQVA